MTKTRYIHKSGTKEPLVLFLHGFHVSPKIHEDFLDILAQDYEVIAPDMITSRPKPNSIDQYVENVAEFIEHHSLPNQNIVGYSLGGGIAFNMSSDKHLYKNIDTVIGLNPVIPVKYGIVGYMQRGLNVGLNESLECGMSQLYQLSNNIIENFEGDYLSSLGTFWDIKNYTFEGKYIKNPCRIIMGTKDEFYGDTDLYEATDKKFANLSIVTLSHRKHGMLVHEPDIVSFYVKDFIESYKEIKSK